MGLYNAEELLKLVNELAGRFSGYENFNIHAHHIYDGDSTDAQFHSFEVWEKCVDALSQIEQCIEHHNIGTREGIIKNIKVAHCIADSGRSITILPDGHIGLCEHFTENEFIGHIDSDTFDEEVVNSWRETDPKTPQCAKCFNYPLCIRLKKCLHDGECIPQHRKDTLRKIRFQMKNDYNLYLNQNSEQI